MSSAEDDLVYVGHDSEGSRCGRSCDMCWQPRPGLATKVRRKIRDVLGTGRLTPRSCCCLHVAIFPGVVLVSAATAKALAVWGLL